MPISIVVPQLGESVAEGTVSKWLKQVGERVRKEEPLVEIQTDKINVELPSPADGVLEAILVPEGTTVLVGTEIGVLGSIAAESVAAPAMVATVVAASEPGSSAQTPASAAGPVALPADASAGAPAGLETTGDSSRQGNLSPAVRKLMREHDVAMSEIVAIRGSGLAGRVSRDDLLEYLKGRARPSAVAPAGPPSPPGRACPRPPRWLPPHRPVPARNGSPSARYASSSPRTWCAPSTPPRTRTALTRPT
jgi:pyruvate dehydrogenase E2 component (dihydrolipoamide acetyltransferase)